MNTLAQTENTITLYWTPDGWMAEFGGPHAAEIDRLFGTTTIPTAFASGAEASAVYAGIKSKNPHVRVNVI
jgi:hypothetical protein